MYEVISLHEHRVTSRGIGGQTVQFLRSRKHKDRSKALGYMKFIKEFSSTYVSAELVLRLSVLEPDAMSDTLVNIIKELRESMNKRSLRMLMTPPEFCAGFKELSGISSLYGRVDPTKHLHYTIRYAPFTYPLGGR